MFDHNSTYEVTNESQDHIGALAKIITSDKRGKLKKFPIVWGNGKKGNVSVYTGTIYKITSVDNGETDSKCRVYFVDIDHSKGNFDCLLSQDETINLINE